MVSWFKNRRFSNIILKFSRIATICALSVYTLFFVFRMFSKDQFVEWYSLSWYPNIRNGFGAILNTLPVPILYILLFFMALWILFLMYYFLRWSKKRAIGGVVELVVFLFSTFYIFWGFNYSSPNFQQRMHLNTISPDFDWVRNTIEKQTNVLDSLRRICDFKKIHTSDAVFQSTLHEEVLIKLAQLNKMVTVTYPTLSNVYIQCVRPGTLLRFETSGIYLSQTFQGHIDDGLSPVQKPFTMVHEMLHGYGITEESDCNLIAYFVCQSSCNPEVRYSGEMAYFRYLAFEYIARDYEGYQAFRQCLSEPIIQDLDDINQRMKAFPTYFPKARAWLYDFYLRRNGISEGMKNYGHFVTILHTIEKSGGFTI